MRLTILGCHGWPPVGGAASGYLVQHDGFTLWLEAGNGTMAKLQEHVALDAVDAIAVSHAHGDHCADLGPYFTALAFGGQGSGVPIPLLAPPRFTQMQWGEETSSRTKTYLNDAFDQREVRGGDRLSLGPLRITVVGVEHPNEAVGYRIEADGAVLAFSGDTGPSDAVLELARGADLFLCEATYQGPGPSEYPYHLSGEQAGAYAAASGVGRLVLTHLWPSLDPQVTLEQAREAFEGEIVLAESGMTMEVGE